MRPPAHLRKCSLGQPNKPHAVVNAARAEPSLGDLEPSPLTEKHVFARHLNILKRHLGVTVRSVVIAKHR